MNFSNGESQKLTFKKVSEEELTRIKTEIRKKAESERKKERIIIALIVLILIIILTVFLDICIRMIIVANVLFYPMVN